VQEDPVHPDVYLVVYHQQERELERRLEHERAATARSGARPRRHRGPLAVLAAVRHRH
jgi:hypothetical protein